MARAEPTIVASSPIARCRKPPTLFLAYISCARSSKRRMSIIACSHSRASSVPGSSRAASLSLTSAMGSPYLVAPPLNQELVSLQARQIGAQRAGELAGVARQRVPEQDDLAAGDLHDLDVLAAAYEQLVGAVGLHAGIARSPSSTRPSTQTAGNVRTPSARARSVLACSASRVPRSSAPLTTAAGCISQAAAAISTLS